MPHPTRHAAVPASATIFSCVLALGAVGPVSAEVTPADPLDASVRPNPNPETLAGWYATPPFHTPGIDADNALDTEPVSLVPPDTGGTLWWRPTEPTPVLPAYQPEAQPRTLLRRISTRTLLAPEDATGDPGLPTADTAESAYLMAPFRSLPTPGTTAAFAASAVWLGRRRRAGAHARRTITGASTHTQFKDPLC